MTTVRPLTCQDFFKFSKINLDPLTETYSISFYLQYLARWPEYMQVAEAPNGDFMGYMLGKCAGQGENFHGHVTAVSVAPEYRRLGLARQLMLSLENTSARKDCYFVDLFVRKSNYRAVDMYKSFDYVIYRTVLNYYSGENEEDAYDMRKALPMDKEKKSIIPLKEPVQPHEVDG